MSTRSKLRAAQRRSELTAIAEAEAEKVIAEGRVKNGRAVLYVPTSQRDIDPYPSQAPKPPKYTKDRWGITLAFRTNRKERRRNGRG